MRVRYHLIIYFFLFLQLMITPAGAQVKITNAFPGLEFNAPIDIQYISEDDSRLFVAEREGQIVFFENDSNAVNKTTFLDISSEVVTTGEGGLLGFTFHPEFEDSNYVYVHYTAGDPFRSVISRFEVSEENPDSVMHDSEFVLMEVLQPYSNHNGGQIRFGPDGYLYIALGDGGGSGDPEENGEDRSTLLGSILRIDVNSREGDLGYAIPSDNPFAGNDQGFREEIYAYGFRNPYRFSFDAATGDLWVGDVGQSTLEEIDLVEAGLNYGWNTMEGSQCYDPETGCDTEGRVLPVYEYGRSEGQSVTGGFIYRGSQVPALEGRYVYADFGSGRIWSFAWDGENASDNQLIDTLGEDQIITFGEDQDQELYIGSFDGNIYRFETEEAVSAEKESELPENLRLEQNYPNPFNPTTLISFHLPEAMYIELSVYDILGQEIATLFEGYRGEGEHSFRFDASELSGGIYIYSLQTPENQITRKMTLMK